MAQGEKSADAAEFFLALGEQSSAVAIAPVAVTGADEAVATPAAAEPRLFRVRAATCCKAVQACLVAAPSGSMGQKACKSRAFV